MIFELLYKKIYMECTEESTVSDKLLTEELEELLKENDIEMLAKEEIEVLVYNAGLVGHKQGFFCAVQFMRKIFAELIGQGG